MRILTPIHIICLCTMLRLSLSLCGLHKYKFRHLINITKRQQPHKNTTRQLELTPVEEYLHQSYVHL